MVYCAFLEIPAWGAGLTFFVLNEKHHHQSTADFMILTLVYTCVPIALYTSLQAKLQGSAIDQPDSDSDKSDDQ